LPGVTEESSEKYGTTTDIPTEIQCRNLLEVKLVELALQV
jgi:hypothetical protein